MLLKWLDYYYPKHTTPTVSFSLSCHLFPILSSLAFFSQLFSHCSLPSHPKPLNTALDSFAKFFRGAKDLWLDIGVIARWTFDESCPVNQSDCLYWNLENSAATSRVAPERSRQHVLEEVRCVDGDHQTLCQFPCYWCESEANGPVRREAFYRYVLISCCPADSGPAAGWWHAVLMFFRL